MRGGVVPTQRHEFDLSRRTLSLVFREVGLAAPELLHHGDTIHPDPVFRSGQWMQQARRMRFPGAEVEIEIVRSVARVVSVVRFSRWGGNSRR